MKNFIDFLLKVNTLKRLPRTGWVWLGIENPETVTDHMFGTAMMGLLLASQKKNSFDLERVIKTALIHDLCEVYAGDMTPYWGLLPTNEEKRKEMLKRWVRLSKEEKEKRSENKFKVERESLLKLIKGLKPALQEEIFSSWIDFERGSTKEGKFVKQVDKIEAMLQAIEYFGAGPDTPVVGWWEEVE